VLLARFNVCRVALILPQLGDKPTLRGHRQSVEDDPVRHRALGIFHIPLLMSDGN
jgi:hypothetical protein